MGFLKGENGVNDYINRCLVLKDKDKLDLNTRYGIEEIMDRRVKQIYGQDAGFDTLLKQGALLQVRCEGEERL